MVDAGRYIRPVGANGFGQFGHGEPFETEKLLLLHLLLNLCHERHPCQIVRRVLFPILGPDIIGRQFRILADIKNGKQQDREQSGRNNETVRSHKMVPAQEVDHYGSDRRCKQQDYQNRYRVQPFLFRVGVVVVYAYPKAEKMNFRHKGCRQGDQGKEYLLDEQEHFVFPDDSRDGNQENNHGRHEPQQICAAGDLLAGEAENIDGVQRINREIAEEVQSLCNRALQTVKMQVMAKIQ